MMLSGMVIGWSAVVPKIQDDKDLKFPFTSSDVKWLGKYQTPTPTIRQAQLSIKCFTFSFKFLP